MRRDGCRGGDEVRCRVVSIPLNTPRGEVVMDSCSACDMRWWTVDGEAADLDGALDGIATTRR